MYSITKENLQIIFNQFKDLFKPIVQDEKELELLSAWAAGTFDGLSLNKSEGDLAGRLELSKIYYELIQFCSEIKNKDYYLKVVRIVKKKAVELGLEDPFKKKPVSEAKEFIFTCCNKEKGFQEATCSCGDIANCK